MSTHLRTWEELELAFDAMLDEKGPVIVDGLPYDRSRIIRILSPADYSVLLNEYADGCGIDTDELE